MKQGVKSRGAGGPESPDVPHTPERSQGPVPERRPTDQSLQSGCLRPSEPQSGDWLGPLKRKWPQHLTEVLPFPAWEYLTENKIMPFSVSRVRPTQLHRPPEADCFPSMTHLRSQPGAWTPLPHTVSPRGCMPDPEDLAPPEVSGQASSRVPQSPTRCVYIPLLQGQGLWLVHLSYVSGQMSPLAEEEEDLKPRPLHPLHAIIGFWLPTDFCLSFDRVPACASMVTPTQNNCLRPSFLYPQNDPFTSLASSQPFPLTPAFVLL